MVCAFPVTIVPEVTPELIEALSRCGLVIVPKNPTAEMLEAGFWPALDETAQGTWEAMIEASPSLLKAGSLEA
jgi:hypothetical protein